MSDFSDKSLKADINFSSSGDNTVIAAPATGRIVIDFISFIPTAATVIQFKSGSTAYGGPLDLSAHQAVTLENAACLQDGLITLAIGAAFVMGSTNATAVGGFIRYRVIDKF